MASDNFTACIPTIFAEEGGLSMVRADPGNWTGGKIGVGALKGTNYGIAASAHPDLDIAHLTKADAEAIYQREYWAPAGCEALPLGLDLMHLDGTVNSGAGYSRGWLAKAKDQAAGSASIHAYAAARLASLHSFKKWATFGKGWAARVATVEAKSLAMALGNSAAPAIAEKAKRATVTAKAASGVSVASAAGGGVVATIVAAHAHPVAAGAVASVSLLAWLWSAFTAHGSLARAAVLTSAAKAA